MNRNRTIDCLKGFAIVMVVVTHYTWTAQQRLNLIFPYLIKMAVPIFMIISGYVGALSFQKHQIVSFADAYSAEQILIKFIRYTVPFAFLVAWEFLDSNIIKAEGSMETIRWIINGTRGQGSYYYPLLIQLIFVFPIIYFLLNWGDAKGLLICFIANAVYELLKWSYMMNEECYRLLIFRYTFLLASGVFVSKHVLQNITSILMITTGAVFIYITTYKVYTPQIITYWTGTSFLAALFIVPIIAWFIQRKNELHFMPLELVGRASYNIFLVQMIYYLSYRKKIAPHFSDWRLELITGCIICICVGLVFYSVESRITKQLIILTRNWLYRFNRSEQV